VEDEMEYHDNDKGGGQHVVRRKKRGQRKNRVARRLITSVCVNLALCKTPKFRAFLHLILHPTLICLTPLGPLSWGIWGYTDCRNVKSSVHVQLE
jgi:hypothetical protein